MSFTNANVAEIHTTKFQATCIAAVLEIFTFFKSCVPFISSLKWVSLGFAETFDHPLLNINVFKSSLAMRLYWKFITLFSN